MENLIRRLEDLSEDDLSRIYQSVFNTENGVVVLADLRNRCFAEMSTIPEGSGIDPYHVMRNEGRRSVLLHIETQLKPWEAPTKKELE